MEEKISLQGLKLRLLISDMNNFFENLTPLKICLTKEQRKEILSSSETYLKISKFYGRYEIIATCLTNQLGYATYQKYMLAYLVLKTDQQDKKEDFPVLQRRKMPDNINRHLMNKKKEMR